jgi:hypothetical protein
MNDDSDEDIPPTVQVIRQGDASDSMPASGDHPGPSRGRFRVAMIDADRDRLAATPSVKGLNANLEK